MALFNLLDLCKFNSSEDKKKLLALCKNSANAQRNQRKSVDWCLGEKNKIRRSVSVKKGIKSENQVKTQKIQYVDIIPGQTVYYHRENDSELCLNGKVNGNLQWDDEGNRKIHHVVVEHGARLIVRIIEKDHHQDVASTIEANDYDQIKNISKSLCEKSEQGDESCDREKNDIEEQQNGTQEQLDQHTSKACCNAHLHEAQEKVVRAFPGSRLFVDGGPGTGKTHTLIQKINHMITQKGIDGNEVHVLCFTNAAVNEIKNRLHEFVRKGQGDRGLDLVDVRTFHSFAYFLIEYMEEEYAGDITWVGSCKSNTYLMNSFDRSLVIAGNVFCHKRFYTDILSSWLHLFVDEVQDITNELAYFVLKLLSACDKEECGFTVLGDSCQAIYGYTSKFKRKDDKYNIPSSKFYDDVLKIVPNDEDRIRLSVNVRQSGEMLERGEKLRNAILTNDVALIKETLIEIKKYSKVIKCLNNDELNIARENGNICLLVRRNIDVISLSEFLSKNGVEHVVNIQDNYDRLPCWVYDIFKNYDMDEMSKEQFFYRNKKNGDGIDSDLRWKKCCEIMHSQDTIDVKDFLKILSYDKSEISKIMEGKSGNIIVSNIHRAKGREYDCVVLDVNYLNNLIDTPIVPLEEYKTLYVAITRPRRELYIADMSQDLSFRKQKIIDGITRHCIGYRNIAKNVNGKNMMSLDKEADVDIIRSVEIVNLLPGYIRRNDEVVLKLCSIMSRKSSSIIRYYRIEHCSGIVIGYMSNNFVCHIKNAFKYYPQVIEGLRIAGVYTKIFGEYELKELQSHSKKCYEHLVGCAPDGLVKWVELEGICHFK